MNEKEKKDVQVLSQSKSSDEVTSHDSWCCWLFTLDRLCKIHQSDISPLIPQQQRQKHRFCWTALAYLLICELGESVRDKWATQWRTWSRIYESLVLWTVTYWIQESSPSVESSPSNESVTGDDREQCGKAASLLIDLVGLHFRSPSAWACVRESEGLVCADIRSISLLCQTV